jgi:hypothetical protein
MPDSMVQSFVEMFKDEEVAVVVAKIVIASLIAVRAVARRGTAVPLAFMT